MHVPVAMISRRAIYLRKAAECEREGDRADIPALKNKYRGIAQQWCEMAGQKKRSAVRKLKKDP
jgi:hypothetical protein